MNWLRKNKLVIVHDGSFHPDDVFCVALLSILYNGAIKVIRTRNEKEFQKADFVLDIGLVYDPDHNRFDHHQEGGAGFRDNKITYSAFGLLWKKYGVEVCGSQKISDILEKKLVEVIDADDMGLDLSQNKITYVYPFMMTDAIYSMRPTWKENSSNIDKFFFKAVDFAKDILIREIKIAKDKIEAESLVDDIYSNSEDKRIIIFSKQYLPKDLLINYPEPLFVVYKEMYGEKWRVTTIEKSENTYECRKNFPESWWGKKDEELAKVSGVSDAVFCRNGGIFAGAKSQEGAIQMAKKALNN